MIVVVVVGVVVDDELYTVTTVRVGRGRYGNGFGGSDSIPDSARFSYSPQRPNQLWGPTSLLFNG
jgi:hypothetical protein